MTWQAILDAATFDHRDLLARVLDAQRVHLPGRMKSDPQ
jgi:hypothetical protein